MTIISLIQGVFSSRGEKILMVDADGATKFEDLNSVERELDQFQGGNDGMAISVGSRAHLQDEAVATVIDSFFSYTRKRSLGLLSTMTVSLPLKTIIELV